MRSRGILVVLTVAAAACESFGEGGTPATPAPDGGQASSDASAGDSASDAGESCPVGAQACHFFEESLVQSPWESVGANKGSGLLQRVLEDGRSFGRAAATGPDARTKLEDRLSVRFEPMNVLEIEFDFRVNAMPATQRFELATLARALDAANYHMTHVAFENGQVKIAAFAQPTAPEYVLPTGALVGPGWHHARLKVEYGSRLASLQIDQAVPIQRNLGTVPTTATASEAIIGFGYAPNVTGAFSVDIDSVIVRGSN